MIQSLKLARLDCNSEIATKTQTNLNMTTLPIYIWKFKNNKSKFKLFWKHQYKQKNTV